MNNKKCEMTANGHFDSVNHPFHYTAGRFEVIDIIEDQTGEVGLRGFCLGNALKYICRSGKKDPDKTIEHLEKAVWYLQHYIDRYKAWHETHAVD